MAELYLRDDFRPGTIGSAAELLRLARDIALHAAPDAVYRQREGRTTVRFELGGRGYFMKLHAGVGWAEIAKNLLQGRLPVIGARNEYRALRALGAAAVDVPGVAAFATLGGSPASRQSVIITDELPATQSLETLCADWAAAPPPAAQRMALLREVAGIARRMHAAGINHRDFYLCHFHASPDGLAAGRPRCHLLDLHRAGLRRRVPRRWRVKDLAALYFSAAGLGLGERDLLRFMRHYCPGGLREALVVQTNLWQRVDRKYRQMCARTTVPVQVVTGEVNEAYAAYKKKTHHD